MKKTRYIIVLSFLLVLALAGCGRSQGAAPEQPAGIETPAQAAPAETAEAAPTPEPTPAVTWPVRQDGERFEDSIVVLGEANYPTLWQIAKERDEINHNMIWMGGSKLSLRGDARGFDQMGIPSLVFTTLNGMHHNHVSSDIWENIDRKILTHVTQVTVETVRELCDGIYKGRSLKSKSMRFGD